MNKAPQETSQEIEIRGTSGPKIGHVGPMCPPKTLKKKYIYIHNLIARLKNGASDKHEVTIISFGFLMQLYSLSAVLSRAIKY